MPQYIGIDPGLKGGWVALDEHGAIKEKAPMPVCGDEVDTDALLRCLAGNPIRSICIERQQAFPKQGVSSTFLIGLNYGLLRGALKAAYSLQIISAKEWQAEMLKGKPRGDETKASALQVAKELWPAIDWRKTERCKVAHDGMVDAVLIAEYGRRKTECLLR